MNENIPTKIKDDEAYYWMDDHIEVACAFQEKTEGKKYQFKHSFSPSDLYDSTLETPFGYFEFTDHDNEFIRLNPEDVNPQFKTTLLLLGIYT